MTARDERAELTGENAADGVADAAIQVGIKCRADDDPISARPWNSIIYRIPSHINKIPTMLSDEEGRMLRWVAEFDYRGAGAICELGTFVGGSTARLAFGLSLNQHARGTIHCYDRYECAENMKQKLLYSRGISEFAGGDVLPLAKSLLREFDQILSFHKGDILDVSWSGGPIEILFLDILKTVPIADHVSATFFPLLIPGRSLLIQQDYFYFRNPWVVVQMELLKDYLDLVGYTDSHSAVFRCRRKISVEAAKRSSWSTLGPEQRSQRLLDAIRRFPHMRQREMLAECRRAADCNPAATVAWQVKLPPPNRESLDRYLAGPE